MSRPSAREVLVRTKEETWSIILGGLLIEGSLSRTASRCDRLRVWTRVAPAESHARWSERGGAVPRKKASHVAEVGGKTGNLGDAVKIGREKQKALSLGVVLRTSRGSYYCHVCLESTLR